MTSPFFILGSGRCGSTYLFALLEKHPHIALTNEAHVLDFLWFCSEYARVPTYEKRVFPLHADTELHGLVHEDSVADFARVFGNHVKAIAEEYYAARFVGKAYRRWGDKLPDPRAALAARDLWPDTDYIVLVRDPRDVLCSFRRFADAGGAAVKEHLPEWGQRTAADFCVEYRTLYGYGLDHMPKHLLLRYEDLVRSPQEVLHRTLTHLGLAADAVHSQDLEQDNLFAKHGTSASALASIGRWRQDLPQADQDHVRAQLADLLTRFGYDD